MQPIPDERRCTAATTQGSRCKAWTAPGLTVCATHAGIARVGQKSKLTRETSNRILAVLRAGGYDETAANAAGISRQQFYEWLKRGRNGDRPYDLFLAGVEEARAEGESRNVMLIAKAAQSNWQAAAWLLERRHPERWARPSQRDKDAAAGSQPPVANDPFSEVDELAQRRRHAGT